MRIKRIMKGVVIAGAAGLALSALPHFSRETIEVTVQDVKGDVIVTDKGEFENTGSAWELNLSPYELKKGQKYLLGVYGWEGTWPFEWKKNIMYAEEIKQDGI